MIERVRRPPRNAAAAALVFTALLASACGGSASNQSSTTRTGSSTSASTLAPVHGAYKPVVDPANFVTRIDNRYFPRLPGTAFHYRGVAENGKTPQADDMVLTEYFIPWGMPARDKEERCRST